MDFCTQFGYNPVPADTTTLCRYVCFLAKKLKYNSLKQYLNYVRLLHSECGFPNPLENNFKLSQTLKGIRRCFGDAVTQKIPVTPDMLKEILQKLDLTKCFDAAVWAICLTMFYGLLRRSNVMVPSHAKFDGSKHLRRQDILFFPWGILIHIRWSKVIQYKSRTFDVPLPRLPDNILCPVKALCNYLRLSSGAPASGPAFICRSNFEWKVISAELFIRRVRECLTSCNPSEIGCHSFRRGCTSLCHAAGFNDTSIKLMGDWASNCFTSYIDNSVKTRLKLTRQLQKLV